MLKFKQIKNLSDRLSNMLVDLQYGRIECIEYGHPERRPYDSYIRIRFIATAGGEQFQIRTLTMGVEGSGDYQPTIAGAIESAMDQVLHYHRPMSNPMIQARLDELRAKRFKAEGKPAYEEALCFFAVSNSSTEVVNRRAGDIETWDRFKEAKVFTLEQSGGTNRG